MGKSYGENNIWAESYRMDGISVVVMKDTLAIGDKTNKQVAEKFSEREDGSSPVWLKY